MGLSARDLEAGMNELCRGLSPGTSFRVNFDAAKNEYVLTCYHGAGRDMRMENHLLVGPHDVPLRTLGDRPATHEMERLLRLVVDRARLILCPLPRFRRYSRVASRRVPSSGPAPGGR